MNPRMGSRSATAKVAGMQFFRLLKKIFAPEICIIKIGHKLSPPHSPLYEYKKAGKSRKEHKGSPNPQPLISLPDAKHPGGRSYGGYPITRRTGLARFARNSLRVTPLLLPGKSGAAAEASAITYL